VPEVFARVQQGARGHHDPARRERFWQSRSAVGGTHRLEILIGGFGLAGLVAAILLIVLAVLWFILPFAIFGTKDRLDRLIAATERGQETLTEIHHELRELRRQLSSQSR
jgi:hypothetical protein